MSNGIIKNTLVFQFAETAAAPSLVEIARFVKAFDADKRTMESSYKISDERVVCIKFQSENAMKEALLQNPEIHSFHYSNGTATEVRMSVAGGCIRYVRIFDLPPEVSDLEVSLVLGKYGTVKRMVREKFPAELDLDLYTGVRGIYMDIKKEIPSTLYFVHRRGRVYYEGLKQRCFLCKEVGHLKASCPQNKRREPGADKINKQVSSESTTTGERRELTKNTYAGAVIGATSSSNDNTGLQLSMVTLVSSKASNSKEILKGGHVIIADEEPGATTMEDPLVDAKQDPLADAEQEPTYQMEGCEQERSNKRSLTTGSKSGSDDGDDSFTTVDKSRKSRKQQRCDDDAERTNPLEAIAATAGRESKPKKQKSKKTQGNRSRSQSKTKVSETNAVTEMS